MPTYIRWREEGATFFFTVVTYRRQRILANPGCRRLLHDAITRVRRDFPFEMPACVLLPDHLHCIWKLPENDDDFPERWRRVKAEFTKTWLAAGGHAQRVTTRQRKEGRRGVWQPRYWEHRIRDEDDYFRYRDYIHLNPVKHGLVDNPADWAWSSFHRHVRLGWLDPDWPGERPVELPDVNE